MQELGDNYYKLHRRDDEDSEEDPFEEEEGVKWQMEEEQAKFAYFKLIAEGKERGYYRQTASEMIEEKSAAKKKKREMEKKRKDDEEKADKSKKDHSPEDDGVDGTQETTRGAHDPTDSFHPQENNMTGVQESSSQCLTTKALDESGEVETGQDSGSTKESDKKVEGDFTKQVTKNHFEEKKADGKDEDESLSKNKCQEHASR